MIMLNIITYSNVELKRSTGFKRGSVVKEEFCKIELDGGVVVVQLVSRMSECRLNGEWERGFLRSRYKVFIWSRGRYIVAA